MLLALIQKTSGAGEGNVGRISVKHTTATENVFVNCDIGDNRSAVCAWTTPANKQTLLIHITAHLKTKTADCDMLLLAREYGGTWQQLVTFIMDQNAIDHEHPIPGGFLLPPKTDIVIRCHSVTQNADISASFTVVSYKF